MSETTATKRDLLEDIFELVRQPDRLSFEPGLVELTVGDVREHMVEHVGHEHPAAARSQQRSPVLLKEHRVLEEARRHVTSVVPVGCHGRQQQASVQHTRRDTDVYRYVRSSAVIPEDQLYAEYVRNTSESNATLFVFRMRIGISLAVT